MSIFLHNKTISKTTPLGKENPFPQFNVASHKRPGIRLSFEDTTTLLSGEGGEGRTGTATMFRKMLSKYTIFSTVLSKIVDFYDGHWFLPRYENLTHYTVAGWRSIGDCFGLVLLSFRLKIFFWPIGNYNLDHGMVRKRWNSWLSRIFLMSVNQTVHSINPLLL